MRYNERDINSRNNDKKIAILKLLSKLDMKFIQFFASLQHPFWMFSVISKFKLAWNANTVNLTLTRPLRIRWFFDLFKVKESSFFKSDLTDPLQIFYAHLLTNTNLSPSRFHFSVGFITISCFESDGFIAYSNVWDWREKNTVYSH